MPSRELQTASFCTDVIVLAPARTVKGATVVALIVRGVPTENSEPSSYRSRRNRRELKTASFCTNVIVLASARTVKMVTVVALIVRGAERRELSNDSIETYVNSSHRSAYGGYSSNSKKVLAPARTVKGIKESSHCVRTVKGMAVATLSFKRILSGGRRPFFTIFYFVIIKVWKIEQVLIMDPI